MADRYEIRYAHEAVGDIRPLRAFDQTRLLDAVARHLSAEPTRVSKSRIKRMVQPFWSHFRLRVDEFRVYYDVDEAGRAVTVLRMKGLRADTGDAAMKTINIEDARSSEAAITEGQIQEVVVLRDGKPLALVVPFDDDDLEWYARERDPAFIESIARARAQAASGRAIGHDELRSQLGKG